MIGRATSPRVVGSVEPAAEALSFRNAQRRGLLRASALRRASEDAALRENLRRTGESRASKSVNASASRGGSN
jgi:hypothetical protein